VIQEVLAEERGGARDGGRGVRGAGRRGVELLAVGEEAGDGTAADAGAVEARRGLARRARRVRLEDAAGDVGAGSDEVGLAAAIRGGTATRERRDVAHRIRPQVVEAALVRAADGAHVFAGAGREARSGRAGGADAVAAGPSLPAAKTITISWLPAAGTAEPAGCASRTRASKVCESTL
jgi:hypothetical protein